jgi:hypothetical protein
MITPAPTSLLIWGPILLLQGGYAVWQLASPKAPRALTHKINIAFTAASVSKVAWSLSWRLGDVILTLLLMVCVLVCLLVIIRLIDSADLTLLRDQLFIKLPFSFYLGWITAATFTNVAYVLISLGVDRTGQFGESLAIIALSAATLLGIWTGIRFRSIAYLLAYIWNVVCILLRHVSACYFNWQYPRFINVAMACLVLLQVAFVSEIILMLRARPKEPRQRQ